MDALYVELKMWVVKPVHTIKCGGVKGKLKTIGRAGNILILFSQIESSQLSI